MKKFRLLSISLIIVLTASLFIGCGAETSTSAETTVTQESVTKAENTTVEAVPYETKEMTSNEAIVSTDVFQAVKPEGWLGIRQYDTTQYSVDGVFPVDETKLCMTKGGTSESDTYTKPTVFIYYEDSAVKLDDYLQWYNEYTLLDDIIINGVQCEACYAVMYSYTEVNKDYVYGIVIYPISENETITYTVTVENPDGEGIDIDDPDVVTIMNGVTLVK